MHLAFCIKQWQQQVTISNNVQVKACVFTVHEHIVRVVFYGKKSKQPNWNLVKPVQETGGNPRHNLLGETQTILSSPL